MEYKERADNGKNNINVKGLWHYLLSIKTFITLVLICGVLLVGYLSAVYGFVMGMALGILPLGLCFAMIGTRYPKIAFYVFFILNYFIMGISRYAMGAGFPFGVLIDAFLLYLALILVIYVIFYKEYFPWKNINNGFTIASVIWLVFCIFQLFNPEGMTAAWTSAIRGVAFYMFAISVIAPIIINKFNDFKTIILIWSFLTVLAVLKALIQKFIGFDQAEEYWLYVDGGYITHIISYGARYFSFFTDAANFGASMAMSMTVFSIAAIFVKSKSLKIWLIIVALLALYGMLISGTRAALAIPFVGYSMLVILSKRVKLIISFSIIIIFSFCFLKYTYIGEGNTLIRRMRTALDPNDPSMQVRYKNQAKLKVYMADKYFGAGLGLSGVKAVKHRPDSYLSTIPTDSWYVMLWVETGIIGLVINLLVMVYVIGYGSYQVLFKIRNNLLKGLNIALIAGCSGMIVASYANEILGQFPNGIIIYTSLAMVFMSSKFDKELTEANRDE